MEGMKDFNNLKMYLLGTPDNPGVLVKNQMSVEQLANAVGLNRSMIYHYISDRHRPDDNSAHAMAKALGVPVADILSQSTPSKRGRPKGSANTKQVSVRSR